MGDVHCNKSSGGSRWQQLPLKNLCESASLVAAGGLPCMLLGSFEFVTAHFKYAKQ